MKQNELKPCPFCGGNAKVKVCDGAGNGIITYLESEEETNGKEEN